MSRRAGGGALAALLWACSSGAPQAVSPSAPGDPDAKNGPDATLVGPSGAAEVAAASPSTSPTRPLALPAECTRVEELCLPPPPFVRALCQDAYTGVAFHLLQQGSPFTRGYVRTRKVQAVNTLGGPSSDQPLTFGEEVLILTRSGSGSPGGLQVSGMGGYSVLRWDGTCATLGDGELATHPPVPPRHAPFSWRYIESNVQTALLEDPAIKAARREHKRHCHGVSLGRLSAACAEAESGLSERVVAAVRAGLPLPVPERMPEAAASTF